jgi:hypothetical protein
MIDEFPSAEIGVQHEAGVHECRGRRGRVWCGRSRVCRARCARAGRYEHLSVGRRKWERGSRSRASSNTPLGLTVAGFLSSRSSTQRRLKPPLGPATSASTTAPPHSPASSIDPPLACPCGRNAAPSRPSAINSTCGGCSRAPCTGLSRRGTPCGRIGRCSDKPRPGPRERSGGGRK